MGPLHVIRVWFSSYSSLCQAVTAQLTAEVVKTIWSLCQFAHMAFSVLPEEVYRVKDFAVILFFLLFILIKVFSSDNGIFHDFSDFNVKVLKKIERLTVISFYILRQCFWWCGWRKMIFTGLWLDITSSYVYDPVIEYWLHLFTWMMQLSLSNPSSLWPSSTCLSIGCTLC